jgi:hypothetical protein
MQVAGNLRTGALVSCAAIALALSGCGRAPSEAPSQVVDGLRFDYGVVPRETVNEHPSDHPERTMHQGGAPSGSDSYHVVLAIFDAKTGARIKDADVTLELSGPGHGVGRVTMPLESMAQVADVTYGGYVSLPASAKYRLTFDAAHAGGRSDTVKARFIYERPQ